MRTYRSPVPFGAVLALLGVGTVIAVGAAVVLHQDALVPVVLGVALVGGLAYLVLTGGAAERIAPAPLSTDPEPFDDPVEEADRLDRSVPPGSEVELSSQGTAPVDGPSEPRVEEQPPAHDAPPTGSLRNDAK